MCTVAAAPPPTMPVSAPAPAPVPAVSGGGGGGGGCCCGPTGGGAAAQATAGADALTDRSDAAWSGAAAAPSPAHVHPAGAASTAKASDSHKADASKWVTGDVKGLDAGLLDRLARLGEQMGTPVKVNSGNRTRAEQEELYRKYLNGTGNLAAKPGYSNHEHGDAADASIGGTSLASNAKAKELALKLGLHFPVKGEPWHVEVK